MSSLLVCSVPYDLSSGSPVCPAPGVLSVVDISVFVGVGSTSIDPAIAVEAFGSGLIIAGVPLVLALVLRKITKPFFWRL